MTVSVQDTVFRYTANGITTSFAYSCLVLADTDLVVTLDGAIVTSGFTISGIGSQTGGNVVFTTAPANLAAVIVRRLVALERTTDYQQHGDWLATVVNPDFDRLWMAEQQQAEQIDRSIKFPVADGTLTTELPPAAERASNLLGFDASGNVVAVAPAAQSASALQALLALFSGSSLVGWIQSGTGAVLRLVQNKLRDSVSVADFGADSTGVADSSTAFSNAGTAASTVHVKDGTYLLNSDVTSTATYILGAAVSFTGTGVLYAPVNRPHTSHYPGRKKTLADVLSKANAGTAITIACYGDSITYSQDTTATGTNVAINGASQTRSGKPYPDALATAIQFAGFTVNPTVLNRGFPGDTTIEGITRWASASATDVSFIMYGHNDAVNYGGYAHGPVSLPNFRQNLSMIIEREIVKGAVVILLGPPPVQIVSQNEKIRSYSAAAKQMAEEYGIQFIDMAEQISPVTNLWTDGVHLSTYAYHEMGWHLAGLFVRRDGASHRVKRGSIYYAPDALGHGGTYYTWATAKNGAGALISLAANQTYAIGAYVEDDCQPVIHSVNATGVNTTLSCYYAGGASGTSGVGTTSITHDQTKGIRQKLVGQTLRRGYRTLYIRNDGTNPAYIEAIEFASNEFATVSRGLQVKSSALNGVFQPARQSVADNWFVAVDYSKKLTDPCNIIARMTLTDTGSGAVNGLALLGALPVAGALDLMCGNMLMVLRASTALILRQLISGAPDTDTTVAAVFPAGVWTGEIELELTAGTMNVYVDGVLKGTRSVAQTEGYASVIGASAARLVCHGLWYSGYVKGPY